MTKFMTATDARKNFYAVIDAAGRPGVPVVITHEGLPKVVVMSFEEFEGWQETMDIMSDPEEAAEILKRLRDKDEETVTLEQLKKNLGLE